MAKSVITLFIVTLIPFYAAVFRHPKSSSVNVLLTRSLVRFHLLSTHRISSNPVPESHPPLRPLLRLTRPIWWAPFLMLPFIVAFASRLPWHNYLALPLSTIANLYICSVVSSVAHKSYWPLEEPFYCMSWGLRRPWSNNLYQPLN